MADLSNPLIAAMRPLTDRVRTDVTAIRQPDGSSRWTRKPLTDEAMAQHLNGGPARGVCPIRAGESVTMVGLIDFDSHKGATSWLEMCVTVSRVADVLRYVHGLSPIVFRSSGGAGVHLYVLWEAPQDARAVRQCLASCLADTGLKNGAGGVANGQAEVFPKQNRVSEDGFGNQFILPLAGASELLELEEMSGTYESRGKVAPDWAFSEPLVISEPPSQESTRTVAPVPSSDTSWRQALDALTNTGPHELDYDAWFRVISAIHHETGGSDAGLALAADWSSRSPKHAAGGDFLAVRVWPYLHSDGRATAVTGCSIERLAAELHGWARPIVQLDAIPDPDAGRDPEADPRLASAPQAALSGATGAAIQSAANDLQPVERRGVPAAKHLTTDLANANRLVKAYGASVLVVAGRWHVWTGKVWKADEADIYRFASGLSAIIRAEAADLKKRISAGSVFGEGGSSEKAAKILEALEKWSCQSEMKGAIEAAVGLARKMLTVDASVMDANPWLLNCKNGVVDLRTGELSPHDAGLYMTKLVDVDYNPGADPTAWLTTLRQITREPGELSPVSDFLQRWFGYCATGDVREQVFVVHWGEGANGKSTVLDLVAKVLGAYAGVAAPGLIASAGKATERHPTELADLRGLRMVVAHESRDGASLTEDTVKAITGGDKIKARYMREDFFEFAPTHKVQLLTNSKPHVRGTDHGIWRRVYLVAYGARFGSAEEVAARVATAVKDKALMERLSTPENLEAVLAWVVAGAVSWFNDGGLRPPSVVIEASEEYRRSQDRIAHFIDECCEVGPGFEEPMMLGSLGLYPTYCTWCKEAGTHPLSRQRFAVELARAVPGLEFVDVHRKTAAGARRKVRVVTGMRIPES